ncbi:MAG: MlaD family protein [Alistipes sp.]|jgi:phospholipid/cholesterol/gamma-HCH transport system substrate-binding protein|nr:MlaD family protein [Alistipes sp.]
MKANLSREMKIGIFAVVMIACLYLGVNYLKGMDVFGGDRPYYALFDRTNGLQTSAPVLLRGVKVGSVTDIYLDREHPDKVTVRVGIDGEVDIPSDSRLVLRAGGLMGDKVIELTPGTSTSHFERGAEIPSEIEGGLLDVASTNMESLMTEARALMSSLTAAAVSLENLMVQNTEAITGMMKNTESVTRDLAEARLGDMIRDMGVFTATLRENSTHIEGIVTNLDEVTGSLAQADLVGTVSELEAGVAGLNDVLTSLSEGEGTAAQLLNNPALYDSLTTATGNLAALLEDLQTNPRRYVHFSLFGGGRDKKK